MFRGRSITLKHVLIDGQKHIGLQFKFDKVTQALVEKLPNISWSDWFGMYHLANTKDNLSVIFNTFRGEVWINGNYFFVLHNELNTHGPRNVGWYRKRELKKNYKRCPAEYLDKLELKSMLKTQLKPTFISSKVSSTITKNLSQGILLRTR